MEKPETTFKVGLFVGTTISLLFLLLALLNGVETLMEFAGKLAFFFFPEELLYTPLVFPLASLGILIALLTFFLGLSLFEKRKMESKIVGGWLITLAFFIFFLLLGVFRALPDRAL